MRVQVYVQKKEADQHFTLAADIDPAFFGLQETLQEVVAKATFHEWSQVAMKFVYPEEAKLISNGDQMKDSVDKMHKENEHALLRACAVELGKQSEGIPADAAQGLQGVDELGVVALVQAYGGLVELGKKQMKAKEDVK